MEKEAAGLWRKEKRSFLQGEGKRSNIARLLKKEETEEEADLRFLRYIHRAMKENCRRYEMGLFRNNSLALAAYALAHQNYEESFEYFLDVLYLDYQGCSNCLSKEHAFSRELGDVIPLMIDFTQYAATTSGATWNQIRKQLTRREGFFRRYGNPPHDVEKCLEKFSKLLTIPEQNQE